jgi:hypothetical protein
MSLNKKELRKQNKILKSMLKKLKIKMNKKEIKAKMIMFYPKKISPKIIQSKRMNQI